MTMTTLLTGAAGRAVETLAPLSHVGWMQPADARTLVNSARGDVIKALGQPRASEFLAELHAATRNVQLGGDPSRGMRDIVGGVIELENAAARTATRRLAIGGLAIGAGLLGAAWLMSQRRGDDDVPMAPGPLDPDPAERGTLA